jgi:hypothetical protein
VRKILAFVVGGLLSPLTWVLWISGLFRNDPWNGLSPEEYGEDDPGVDVD